MQTPLEIINLTKEYNGKNAVKNISFNLNQNEIIGILGPNGSGKTTTIGMILGLLKPTAGKILINGIEIENKGRIIRKFKLYFTIYRITKKIDSQTKFRSLWKTYDVKNLKKIEYLSEKLSWVK